MTWMLALGAVVVTFVGWFFYQQKKPGDLNAKVALRPNGEHDIEFEGEMSDENLALLGLTYGAKLAWLSIADYPGSQQLFDTLTLGASAGFQQTSSDNGESPTLQEKVPTQLWVEPPGADEPAAAEQGESYVARFHRPPDGNAWVANDLPSPRVQLNLSWHYFLLLDAIHAEMDESLHHQFGEALNKARTHWRQQSERSRKVYEEMNAIANAAWPI